MNKSDLRTIYKHKRKSLTQSEIDTLSLKIANQTLKLPMSILFGKDKHIVVPKSDISSCEMTHFLLSDNTIIKPNIWNIPEPQNGIQIQHSQLQVIFVPLLAFDQKGQRVGYGKGFYDLFLKSCPKAIKIGLSFFGAVDEIEDKSTQDIPLDYCITPNQIYQFN